MSMLIKISKNLNVACFFRQCYGSAELEGVGLVDDATSIALFDLVFRNPVTV